MFRLFAKEAVDVVATVTGGPQGPNSPILTAIAASLMFWATKDKSEKENPAVLSTTNKPSL